MAVCNEKHHFHLDEIDTKIYNLDGEEDDNSDNLIGGEVDDTSSTMRLSDSRTRENITGEANTANQNDETSSNDILVFEADTHAASQSDESSNNEIPFAKDTAMTENQFKEYKSNMINFICEEHTDDYSFINKKDINSANHTTKDQDSSKGNGKRSAEDHDTSKVNG